MDTKNTYHTIISNMDRSGMVPQGARYVVPGNFPKSKTNQTYHRAYNELPGGGPQSVVDNPNIPKVTYRQGGAINPYEPQSEDLYSYANLPDSHPAPPRFDQNPEHPVDPRVVMQKLDYDFDRFAREPFNENAVGQNSLPPDIRSINDSTTTQFENENQPSGVDPISMGQVESRGIDYNMSNGEKFETTARSEERFDPRVRLTRSILGDVQLAGHAYPHVYKDTAFLQPPQSNLILNPKPFYLAIDSRDRDRKKWPNPAHFQIPLVSSDKEVVCTPGREYRNIYSIELMSATVPNFKGVLLEPYLLLQIDEIDDVYDATNLPTTKSFVKLHFSPLEIALSPFLRLDRNLGEPYTTFYYPKPLSSLQKMTFSIRKHDGTLFNFGTDTKPNLPPNPKVNNSWTFQIRTYIPDVNEAIGQRNV